MNVVKEEDRWAFGCVCFIYTPGGGGVVVVVVTRYVRLRFCMSKSLISSLVSIS